MRAHNKATKSSRFLIENQCRHKTAWGTHDLNKNSSRKFQIILAFSKSEAFNNFSQSFSASQSNNMILPQWIQTALLPAEITVDFDLTRIISSHIRGILKKYKKKSAPGKDGIAYYHLRILLICHYFLATLYSKILLESMLAPSGWGKGGGGAGRLDRSSSYISM